MKTRTIGFIGGGRITRIMLHAFENSSIRFDKIVVFDTNSDALALLKEKYPYATVTENWLEAVMAEVVFLAVHPPVMMDTLATLKGKLNRDSLLVSLAPKISMDKMVAALDGFDQVARMNPSASSFVNKGVNPVAFGGAVSTVKKSNFLEMIQPLGRTPEIAESKMEAYAVISAMGHTYFFFQLQKLRELAVEFGMDNSEAKSVISDMLWGTTETLFKSELSYEEVIDLVPVKPMAEAEERIKKDYDEYLRGIFMKIKP